MEARFVDHKTYRSAEFIKHSKNGGTKKSYSVV